MRGAAGGQAQGAAVAGRVDGDDLEAHRHQAGQRLGVEDALGREPVDQHERHAPAADGHADLVPVGEGDEVAGQAGRADLGRVGGLRSAGRSGPTTGVTGGAVSMRSTRAPPTGRSGRSCRPSRPGRDAVPAARATVWPTGDDYSTCWNANRHAAQRGQEPRRSAARAVVAVLADLGDEVVDRRRTRTSPRSRATKRTRDVLAVEVAVEVEQVGLEQRGVGLLVERRPATERDGGRGAPAPSARSNQPA